MIAGNSHYDVLLVDDDAGDANLTRLAIGEGPLACRLHYVKDGVEALAFLRRENGPYAEAPRPDLVLLDLNMPRKNGREVLEEVKADPDLRTIPVVVMTTSDADWDIEEAYRLGANSFVTKSADLDQFIATIHALETYWFGTVKLPR